MKKKKIGFFVLGLILILSGLFFMAVPDGILVISKAGIQVKLFNVTPFAEAVSLCSGLVEFLIGLLLVFPPTD